MGSKNHHHHKSNSFYRSWYFKFLAITRHGVTGYSQLCVILMGMIAGTILIVLTDGDQELPAWWTKYLQNELQNENNSNNNNDNQQNFEQEIPQQAQPLYNNPPPLPPASPSEISIDAEEELASLKQFINDAVQSAVQNQVQAIKSELDTSISSQINPVDIQNMINDQISQKVAVNINKPEIVQSNNNPPVPPPAQNVPVAPVQPKPMVFEQPVMQVQPQISQEQILASDSKISYSKTLKSCLL